MKQFKRTPGPWFISDASKNFKDVLGEETRFGVAISSAHRHSFAFVYTKSADEPDGSDIEDSPEHEGNAKLIEKAPEILEALQWTIQFAKSAAFYPEQKDKVQQIETLLKQL